MRTIDLNADAGESYGRWELGDDANLIPLLTSVNVACGFHAGDPSWIRRTVALAARHGVVVGAHVSYFDIRGFGRREVPAEPRELENDILYQIGALEAICRAEGTEVRYVKPHGALYHTMVRNETLSAAVIEAVAGWGRPVPLMAPIEGDLAAATEARGIRVVNEGFAERGYLPNGRLVPRGQPGDIIHEPAGAAAQALALADGGAFQSLCIHGDSPNAVAVATAVRDALVGAGYELRPFV